jgi:23S rRNA pseudoU1915 N3-methylase RlmH
VDIDFLTDESYARGFELVSQITGAKIAKHDPSIGSIEFKVDYPTQRKVRKVKIKVELVNVQTKNINKNVKEDLQSIESNTGLHTGARIPTIGAMIINWMDRKIESETSEVHADRDKSKRKGDRRSIIIMAGKHGITYDILQNYMKTENPRYREIWSEFGLH